MTVISKGTRREDGVLEFELEARPATVRIGGREVEMLTYEGSIPGPTLVASEGDRVRIVFRNALPEPTNLHVHGMRMPAEVDDPHRVLEPGQAFAYEWDIPEGAAGTYWYHPHVHGEVAWQLGAGLAGAMIVRGPRDRARVLEGATEHVLVLQDAALRGNRPRHRSALEMHDGREGEHVLVSGRSRVTADISTGLSRLRIINASSARFHDLVFEGAEAHLLGLDAAFLESPVPIDHVLLPPGQRADVVVLATRPGQVKVCSRPYDRGVFHPPWSRERRRRVLAAFEVQGPPRRVELPPAGAAVERLDPRDAVTTRIFEFGGEGSVLRMVLALIRRRTHGPGSGASGPVRFWLNGREFEPGRIDVEAELGTSEVWELRNPTPMDHPFHLHIHPFQVLDVDGVRPAFVAWRDVVNVPAGSTVRIIVPFRDHAGTTMYHCHIVEHEDNGMMGHLRVVDRRGAAC